MSSNRPPKKPSPTLSGHAAKVLVMDDSGVFTLIELAEKTLRLFPESERKAKVTELGLESILINDAKAIAEHSPILGVQFIKRCLHTKIKEVTQVGISILTCDKAGHSQIRGFGAAFLEGISTKMTPYVKGGGKAGRAARYGRETEAYLKKSAIAELANLREVLGKYPNSGVIVGILTAIIEESLKVPAVQEAFSVRKNNSEKRFEKLFAAHPELRSSSRSGH